MLTKTESTALLRYLARGLKNNTISKAHGRQLMDLAGNIRKDSITRKLPKGLSKWTQTAIDTLLQTTNKDRNVRSDITDIFRRRFYDLKDVQKDLENNPGLLNTIQNIVKNKNRHRGVVSLARTVATPTKQLLNNPKNKIISQGTFLGGINQRPYQTLYSGVSASGFGNRLIDTRRRSVQFLTAKPGIATQYGGGYTNSPDSLIIAYNYNKLRDDRGLPLLPTPQLGVGDRFSRLQGVLSHKSPYYGRPIPIGNKTRYDLSEYPYYQYVAYNQPGFRVWDAIDTIYKPFLDTKNKRKKYLKLDNWRDAFRPSKTLDMYTQLYS